MRRDNLEALAYRDGSFFFYLECHVNLWSSRRELSYATIKNNFTSISKLLSVMDKIRVGLLFNLKGYSVIQESIAKRVLTRALQTGGDFAELFAEDTEGNNLSMIDHDVEKAGFSRSRGAGIRVLSGSRSVYTYTNDLSEDGLMKTAASAANALTNLKKSADDSAAISFSQQRYQSPAKETFKGLPHSERIKLIKTATIAAKAYSDDIVQTRASYMDSEQRILVANSDGLWAEDHRHHTRMGITAIARKGADTQTGSVGPGRGLGFEFYQGLDLPALGREAAEQAVTMLHAPDCPAGYLPVVLDGGFGGVIFHEACGHSLEATSVAKGNSEFSGKLGQQIASTKVSAVDDGTLAGEWGSLNIDDEGMPTQKNQLIKDGILTSYLIDKIGGRRMGMDPTGSARRQSYEYAPTSRMTNTYIESGTDDNEEMIASIEEGLYAKALGGGSVNPLTGQFNFNVREGYWIKNGKIVTAVRGATLIGKGSDILTRIDRVGPDHTLAEGMCGSVSGSLPVTVGQPRIRVSELTIGGKGENIE